MASGLRPQTLLDHGPRLGWGGAIPFVALLFRVLCGYLDGGATICKQGKENLLASFASLKSQLCRQDTGTKPQTKFVNRPACRLDRIWFLASLHSTGYVIQHESVLNRI